MHGWEKPRLGTGYWVRDNLELLLIAARGHPVAPAPGQQLPALIPGPQGPHSAKPPAFAEMIERLYPNVLRLEMFARGPLPAGWTQWRNEIDEARTGSRRLPSRSEGALAAMASVAKAERPQNVPRYSTIRFPAARMSLGAAGADRDVRTADAGGQLGAAFRQIQREAGR